MTEATQNAVQAAIDLRIARELGVRESQVSATVALLDEGATVPFVARYRKEVTGGLDDAQLRTLAERLVYLRELEERRTAVLASIEEQKKLTPELRAAILAADTKQRLEDLYLPYKQKRRTKAMIARERGLEPLARTLLADPTQDPNELAQGYVDTAREVPDVETALDGARQILMEDFAEDPELVGTLRERVWAAAELRTAIADPAKAVEAAKFSDYFEHREPLARAPSHRVLAILRGRNEGFLRMALCTAPDDTELADDGRGLGLGAVLARFSIRDEKRKGDAWLLATARLAWRVKLAAHVETQLVTRLREAAEEEAIAVFARNLHDLLLAAPAGRKRILGLDPGLRTGVKVAVVDETGKVLETTTVYPTPPREDVDGTLRTLESLIRRHGVTLVSLGNGTGSRETDAVVGQLLRRVADLGVVRVMANEAGASVYSASELASKELPSLDVSLRGAVSIARRVQDPLAELVKIEPKSIGVGQYQHDVNQVRLGKALDAVVEDCVNGVGVDLNTASPALLARVAGLSPTLAENVVSHRDANGRFARRKDLLEVPRLGKKAFEQCAGFLRIPDGDDPLDASAVHPEAYDVVRRIEQATGRKVRELIGDSGFLRTLDAKRFTDERFGEPTVQDILRELEKPGRDPRPEWKSAALREDVKEITDLQPGMQLEGTVTNVAAFGAFVDIGVHQDGLVHVSRLSERFVEDPRSVVRAGQVVRVKVLEIDVPRKRIALSMRMSDEPGQPSKRSGGDAPRRESPRGEAPRAPQPPRRPEPEVKNAFARAFGKLEKPKG
ncbi:MAG: RNA-binding transcriptional accessory protein [Planctomycetes bacterium]|nr:RNA-binding transcriptional accessory protein [Planctomycetota bacterium]